MLDVPSSSGEMAERVAQARVVMMAAERARVGYAQLAAAASNAGVSVKRAAATAH